MKPKHVAILAASILAILLACKDAKAKTLAVSCLGEGIDLVFATTVTDDAKSLRRTYTNDDGTYMVYISNLDADQYLNADITVVKNGKQVHTVATCYTEGDK